MKPPPFRYHAPETLEEALSLLAEYGDEAKPLAGGQSLVPAMSFRLARPAVLIDLGRLDGLDFIRRTPQPDRDEIRLGALSRQRTAERSEMVAEEVPLLAGALPHVAHPQIRSRGTIGGSLVHADPAAELPAVLAATGGRCRLASLDSGERWVDAEDFFTGLFETARRDDELLVEIAFPARRRGEGWGFHEFARRHGDYALVGVAAVVRSDVARSENGKITDVTIALFSVGDGPVLVKAPELVGLRTDDVRLEHATREAAERIAAREIDPPGDIQASPEYRRHLAGVLIRRALEDAARRAEEHR